jgi:hypothetical protein
MRASVTPFEAGRASLRFFGFCPDRESIAKIKDLVSGVVRKTSSSLKVKVNVEALSEEVFKVSVDSHNGYTQSTTYAYGVELLELLKKALKTSKLERN